jgi:para-aminobenzoate synthetase component 1
MKRYPLIEPLLTSLKAPQAFALFKDEPYAFFLDSGMDPQRLGRYSFIGGGPFLVITSRGRQITVDFQGRKETIESNPFDVLDAWLRRYRLDSSLLPVPFAGGAVGYLGYDLCHFIERLPGRAAADIDLPECYFAFYDAVLAYDHLDDRVYVISTGFPEETEERRLQNARERLSEVKQRFIRPALSNSTEALPPVAPALRLRSNFTRDAYIRAVVRAREYICAGDIFQVNLSQRFEAELSVSPYELHRRIRGINPAPFGAYLDMGGGRAVVCASPERFLKLSGDMVETRPIKGTRPRGKNPRQDAALAKELVDSIKDRAENVMIVDLERNDLGRVCRYGSVRVTELAILETFPTVFHLTSTVVGQLTPDKTGIDLLKASFPGGSITGAPKVRSMEIIDELEPTRRSVYTGALGYLGFNGDLDLNIVIRTFLISGRKVYFQVGGGIVYDSEPAAEYQETLDKAKALFMALRLAPEVSTVTA